MNNKPFTNILCKGGVNDEGAVLKMLIKEENNQVIINGKAYDDFAIKTAYQFGMRSSSCLVKFQSDLVTWVSKLLKLANISVAVKSVKISNNRLEVEVF